MDDAQRILPAEHVGHGSGPVGRVVVHDDELPRDSGGSEGLEHRRGQFGDAASFVVRRDNERQIRRDGVRVGLHLECGGRSGGIVS
jgi:hypothetical protein